MHNYNQVHNKINQWRQTIIRNLILFLAVVNAIGTILQYFSLTYTPTVPEHIIVWGLTLILIVVAITRRMPSSVKAIIVILLIYTAAVKQLLTHGIVSSSPVYLIAAPVIAFFIIGKKAGWITFCISTMIFTGFTFMVFFNALPQFSYIPVDPLNYRVWIEIGISMIIAVLVILLVVINYHRFVTGTIQQALEQSEENALLEKEVHHRVKNNLALMKSLMQMQANMSDNSEFKHMSVNLQGRIHSLALVHEMLYEEKEKRKIDIRSYVQSLGTNLLVLHQKKNLVKIVYDIDRVNLHIDQATPLGLLLNEILTNSLLHAFADERDGRIWISIHVSVENLITIVIHDNGPGLSETKESQTRTLGIQLIDALATQLNATLRFDNTEGAKYSIQFKTKQSS